MDRLDGFLETTHKHVSAIIYESISESSPWPELFVKVRVEDQNKRPRPFGAGSFLGLRTDQFVPYPYLVHQYLVRIIEDVAGEFVMHTHAVEEVGGGKGRVADLDTDLCFKRTDSHLDLALVELLHGNEEVEASVELTREDTGKRNELHGTDLLEVLEHRRTVDRSGLKKERLERCELWELRIECISLHAHLDVLRLMRNIYHLLTDDVGTLKRVYLRTRSAAHELCSARDIIK